MIGPSAQSVLFEERRADNGARAGIARLNAEKSLNSLSLEMIDLLLERLSAWATDPASHSSCWKRRREGVCAGADFTVFTGPWWSITRQRSETTFAAMLRARFFSREYRLDY